MLILDRNWGSAAENTLIIIYPLDSDFEEYCPGHSEAIKSSGDKLASAISKGHTQNTAGVVGIKGTGPSDTLLVNFRFFNDGNDTKSHGMQAVV